jgi:flagellar L-ring protein precursor FlgH
MTLLTACGMPERISRIGKAPDFQDMQTYEDEIVEDHINKGLTDSIMQANTHKEITQTANSLWKPGAKNFFRDQRARSVGDILKVIITIADKAKLDNQTQSGRNDTGNLGVPNLFGLETHAKDMLPKAVDPTKLASISSKDANSGYGKIDRKETVNTTLAATVIKILPSNNLVIRGTQEIRINNEVREMTIEGIVRPEDISAQNSVTLDQIAEARVNYGGRGTISEYQQPRYGKQLLEIISPF